MLEDQQKTEDKRHKHIYSAMKGCKSENLNGLGQKPRT